MIKKINYILNRKQKILLIFLLLFWSIIYILETISLGSVPIILSSILEEKNIINIPILEEVIIYLTSLFPKDQNKLFLISVIIILFFVFKSLLFALATIYEANTIKELNISLREKIFKYYLNLPYKDNINVNNSLIIRHITLDASLASSLIISLITLINQILLFIFIISLLIYINYQVTFLILPVFGVFFYIFYSLTNKRLIRLGKEKQIIHGDIIKKINNFFDNLKEVIIYNKINYLSKNFKIDLINSNTKIAKIIILKKIPKAMYELLGIIFIFFIIFYFVENDYSKETIVITLSLITIAIIRILPSINLITQNISIIKSCQYSFETIFDLHKKIQLNQLEDKTRKNYKKISFNKNLEFKNVYFNYTNSKSKLDNINLNIKKNTVVGIFGPSGSGKTTFVNLLSGLFHPSKGDILSDNNSINDNILDWQKKISYIPQDNYLLDATILENIIFSVNDERINFDKINEIIETVNLRDFLDKSLNGLETQVGDKGIKLSGGQKQRIAIARALYKESEILIFDESTSSLDQETENSIIQDIYNIKTKTIFLISHKIEILSKCNQIIELSDGKVKDIKNLN